MPTLVLTGALDGRTFLPEQRAALAGMRNVTTVTVENAGRNLFMLSPEIVESIGAFLNGDIVQERTIAFEAPGFAPRM